MIRRFSRKSNNLSGIYAIRSRIDNRLYVGSAKRFRKRFTSHCWQLKQGNHRNQKLQNFANKYGQKSLEFMILECCEISSLIEREQFYINSMNPSFNICKKAGSTLGTPCSEDKKMKISLANSGKKRPITARRRRTIAAMLRSRNVSAAMRSKVSLAKSIAVAQYDLNGKFITSFASSKDAAAANGLSRSDVNACCHGKKSNCKIRRAGKYQWRFFYGSTDNIAPYRYFISRASMKNKRHLPDVVKKCSVCHRGYMARGACAWKSKFCSGKCRSAHWRSKTAQFKHVSK